MAGAVRQGRKLYARIKLQHLHSLLVRGCQRLWKSSAGQNRLLKDTPNKLGHIMSIKPRVRRRRILFIYFLYFIFFPSSQAWRIKTKGTVARWEHVESQTVCVWAGEATKKIRNGQKLTETENPARFSWFLLTGKKRARYRKWIPRLAHCTCKWIKLWI